MCGNGQIYIERVINNNGYNEMKLKKEIRKETGAGASMLSIAWYIP